MTADFVWPAAIEAGSREPSGHDQAEDLLRLVPYVAFAPELVSCIEDGPEASSFEALWTDPRRERLVAGLEMMAERAAATSNGGLAFLARTMLHFLQREPIADREHPLLVGLYVRTRIQKDGERDHPTTVGRRMNDWA